MYIEKWFYRWYLKSCSSFVSRETFCNTIFSKKVSDSSNFILHIPDIFHFQGIIYSFLNSFQNGNIVELPIINSPRNSSNL